jgi:hypothetical protein
VANVFGRPRPEDAAREKSARSSVASNDSTGPSVHASHAMAFDKAVAIPGLVFPEGDGPRLGAVRPSPFGAAGGPRQRVLVPPGEADHRPTSSLPPGTALPGVLRSGNELVSGNALRDATVHRDSARPLPIPAPTDTHMGSMAERGSPVRVIHRAETAPPTMGTIQRYLNPELVEYLNDLDALKAQLTPLIKAYNAKDKVIEPDFYGYYYFSRTWYKEQVATLNQITALVGPITGQTYLGFNLEAMQKFALNISREKQSLAQRDLASAPRSIPGELHFIWSGRAISEAAQRNIVSWKKRADVAEPKWNVNIWTEFADSNWTDEILRYLNDAGVKVKGISQELLGPRLAPSYYTLIQGRNYPAASDLARYAILKDRGGIYIDVDIAPGEFRLTNTPVPALPTLAPEIRDAQAVREELDLKAGTKVTPKMVEDVAKARLAKGQHNNNFIMTPEGSAAMEAVIVEVVARLEKQGGAQSLIRDPIATAAVTGPVALKRGLWNYIQKEYPYLDPGEAMDVLTSALNKALPVQWLTPESESQEH